MTDELFMRHAVSLANRMVGRTAENPPVGCVVVKDGIIVGRGWTADGGRPHAEAMALAAAAGRARDATAYVTLEPCSHVGKTGPCADALIAAGVARVVVAIEDPDPRVSGKGLEKLRRAGVTVVTGCAEALAAPVLAGFINRITRHRPYVTLKLATGLDGTIALANGESQWITGAEARAHAHLERARHDAILVGAGTVAADNPSLTCRLPGLERYSPKTVILDRSLRVPPQSAVLQNKRGALIFTSKSKAKGAVVGQAEIIPLSDPDDLRAVLHFLADQGINRLLVEGGAVVATRFLQSGCVDHILHYKAGKVLGGDGLHAIGSLGLSKLGDAPIFTPTSSRRLGSDILTRYSNQKAE